MNERPPNSQQKGSSKVSKTDLSPNRLAPHDPRHGTPNGYGNLGCRCGACRAANTAHIAERRRRPGGQPQRRTAQIMEPLPGEIWQAIPGYEGVYEASSLGRIRSLDHEHPHWTGNGRVRRTGKLLSPATNPGGYSILTLSKHGQHRGVQVHVLVLEAFVGPRPSAEMDACHGNGDPSDNRLENLRWDTKSANALDTVRHGTHPQSRRTSCKRGHEFTPENTDTSEPGHRRCKTCRGSRGTGLGQGWQNAIKTHCKRGHEFTPENTYMRPTGRECKACRAVHAANCAARKTVAA